jgi:hypothetical protein
MHFTLVRLYECAGRTGSVPDSRHAFRRIQGTSTPIAGTNATKPTILRWADAMMCSAAARILQPDDDRARNLRQRDSTDAYFGSTIAPCSGNLVLTSKAERGISKILSTSSRQTAPMQDAGLQGCITRLMSRIFGQTAGSVRQTIDVPTV